MRHLVSILVLAAPLSAFATEGRATAGSMGFVENRGQVVDQNVQPNPDALYVLAGPRYNVQLRRTGFSYDFFQVELEEEDTLAFPGLPERFRPPPDGEILLHRIDFELLGCNASAAMETHEPSVQKLNYYTAGAPKGGVKDLLLHGRVIYRDIYPNIDLEFLVDAGHGFKYNFLVHPGGNAADIRLRINGANTIEEGEQGLRIGTRFGNFLERVPECSWTKGGEQGRFAGRLQQEAPGVFGFALALDEVPAGSELLIDPVPELLWCTLYGGMVGQSYYSLAVDNATGYRVISGGTPSTSNLATAGAYQVTYGGGTSDAIMLAFDGQDLPMWCTYFGSTGREHLFFAEMNANWIFGAGSTTNNPISLVTDTLDPYGGGPYDGLLAKFDRTNGYLERARFYGGPGEDRLGEFFLSNNALYVPGVTTSTQQIATFGAHQTQGGGADFDAMLIRFDHDLNRQWGTYYGGTEDDSGGRVVMDAGQKLYLFGATQSPTGIATPGRERTTYNSVAVFDDYIAKWTMDGERIWGSYYGGQGSNFYTSIEARGGHLYVFGHGNAPQPMTADAYQADCSSQNRDLILMKLDTAGFTQWATYFGAPNGGEGPQDFDIVGGSIYLLGMAIDTALNTPDPLDSVVSEGDLLLVKFDTSGVMQWSTAWGGPEPNYGWALEVVGSMIHVVGLTFDNECATPGAFQTDTIGECSLFLARLQDCQGPLPVATAPISGTALMCAGTSATYTTTTVPDAVEYDWSVSAGNTILSGDGTTSISVQFGALPAQVSVRARNGCGTAPDQVFYVDADTSFQMTISPTGPISLCVGDEVVLSASNAASYLWSNGSTADTVLVMQSGTFSVTGISTLGCIDVSSTVQVQVNPVPTPTVFGNANPDVDTAWPYETFSPIANDYIWTVNGGTIQNGQGTDEVEVYWAVPGPGWVAVEETTPLNCTDHDTMFVNVIPISGLEEHVEGGLLVAPVLANDGVRVSLGTLGLPGTLLLLDESGREVNRWTNVLTDGVFEFTVNGLANGTYVLQFTDPKMTLRSRFVIQH